MKLFFAGKLIVYSLIVVFLFLSSCSSYYWTTIDNADLEAGDSVYRVKLSLEILIVSGIIADHRVFSMVRKYAVLIRMVMS